MQRHLIPACEGLYGKDFIFLQDGAPAHRSTICQTFLKETLGRGRYTKHTEWPPCSADANPLDYYFWDKVQNKVYEGRLTPFENLEQLKRRIRVVWDAAIDLSEIRAAIEQFRPRLQAIVEHEGFSIKAIFG